MHPQPPAVSPEVLARLLAQLQADFGLHPVMATEIEFYLHGASAVDGLEEKFAHLCSTLESLGIAVEGMEVERGEEQYEIALLPQADIANLIAQTERLKLMVTEFAAGNGMEADFRAKPKADQPGSGLHVHVHLEDGEGNNVFFRNADASQEYSPPLRHALAGMLALMPASMPHFAPTSASYDRYVPGGTAPTHLSWGPNNRTVALRLPRKPMEHKHIEHRVSGADADVASVIAAMLAGIHHGLATQAEPMEAIHGEAWREMYGLPRLPFTQEDALAQYAQATELQKYLGA
jgi:glutamine synthetase